MKRLEIFANRSVEEDLLSRLVNAIPEFNYSLIPLAHGSGASQPKKGTAIWPEENFILIVYDTEDRIRRMAAIIDTLKNEYPREGVRYFELP